MHGRGQLRCRLPGPAGSDDGTYNLAVSVDALKSVVSGGGNVAVGAAAGQSTTGSNGTFVGRYAGYTTTGGGCVAVGNTSGGTNTSGTNNTWLGTFADNTANNFSKAIAIGYNAKAGASNACVIGGTSADAVKLGVNGTQAPICGIETAGAVRATPVTVANLPSAALGDGMRAFVTDSMVAAISGNFGIAVMGGGSNKAPVFSRDSAWYIG